MQVWIKQDFTVWYHRKTFFILVLLKKEEKNTVAAALKNPETNTLHGSEETYHEKNHEANTKAYITAKHHFVLG